MQFAWVVRDEFIFGFVPAALQLPDVAKNHRHVMLTRKLLDAVVPRCFLVQEGGPPGFGGVGGRLIEAHDDGNGVCDMIIHPGFRFAGRHHFQAKPFPRSPHRLVHLEVREAFVNGHGFVRDRSVGCQRIEFPVVHVATGDDHAASRLEKGGERLGVPVGHPGVGNFAGHREMLDGLDRDVGEVAHEGFVAVRNFIFGQVREAAAEIANDDFLAVTDDRSEEPGQKRRQAVEHRVRQSAEQFEEDHHAASGSGSPS